MKRSAQVLFVVAVSICGLASVRVADAAAVGGAAGQRCARSDLNVAAVTHRAGLVVTYGDRHSQTFCIEFSENTISGLEQLQRSGLPLVTSGSGGLGAAVCSIGGEGSNDPTNCFGSCAGGTCAYWAYYRYADGAWKFSQAGASQVAVHDGDILGWSWGPGGNSSGTAPSPPGEICPRPAATATTIAPTFTAMPLTATPVPQTPPSSQAPLPTNASVAPTPPAASEPTDDSSPSTTVPASSAGAIVAVSPVNAVAGVAATPPAGTESSTVTAPTPTPTAKSGVVVIHEQQGKQNQSHSESQGSSGGGSSLSLIIFGFVVIVLIGAAGGITYWRRRAV